MKFNSILETIGNTPHLKINKLFGKGQEVWIKLEKSNPGGSIKDRIALSMIEDAEKKGIINKGTIIVEPTSGNTGIALAFTCAVKGYRLILTMPESMSVERRSLMTGLGAEIVLTEAAKGMKGAIAKAEEIVEETLNAFIPQQFQNPSNPEVHRKTTAEEIWKDTDGKIDILVSGVGTGGSITGISEVIKSKKHSLKSIAVEPAESPVLSGGSPSPHKIQGIGAGFVPDILNTKIIDEIIQVTNEDAIETAKKLIREEGILCGISSGAAMWAALQAASRKENKGKMIVVILPDTAERYLSTDLFKF